MNEEAGGGWRGRESTLRFGDRCWPGAGCSSEGRRTAEGSAIPRQVGRRACGEGGRVALAEHFRHGVPRESILSGIVDGD